LAILEKGGKNIPFNRPGPQDERVKIGWWCWNTTIFFFEKDPYFLMCGGLVFNAVS